VDATFAQRVADATHVKLIEGERPGVLLPLVGMVGTVGTVGTARSRRIESVQVLARW